jgi:DNA-binding transcriptional ArsR family regulator
MSALALQIIRDPEAASVLLDPRRQALLRLLQSEPNTASGLGKLLEMPRQKVNYHLHELERVGLVEQVESNRKGSVVERFVRARAAHYLISPEALGSLGPDPASRRDRFSCAFLIATASRIINDIATLTIRATQAKKRLSTLTLETEIRFRTSEDRASFADELANFIAAQTARYHDEAAPGGRTFHLVAAAWPKITKGPEAGTEAALLEN